MERKVISTEVPGDVAERVDVAASAAGLSRAAYLRRLAVEATREDLAEALRKERGETDSEEDTR